MGIDSPIEKSRSPFASLVARFGMAKPKTPEQRSEESRMATEGELTELAELAKPAEFKAEVDAVKTQLKQMHDKLSTRDNYGSLPKKLTDNGDKTYGLFENHPASSEYMLMYLLNTPTDYTAYYQFRKMEGNTNVVFDQKTGDPLKLEVYNVKGMQADNAQESRYGEYRKTLTFPAIPDDAGKENLEEIKKVLKPYFESFDKPQTPPVVAK